MTALLVSPVCAMDREYRSNDHLIVGILFLTDQGDVRLETDLSTILQNIEQGWSDLVSGRDNQDLSLNGAT